MVGGRHFLLAVSFMFDDSGLVAHLASDDLHGSVYVTVSCNARTWRIMETRLSNQGWRPQMSPSANPGV